MKRLYLATLLAALFVDNQASAIIRAPFGPRMCEDLCGDVMSCSAYAYKTADLECLVMPGNGSLEYPSSQTHVMDVDTVNTKYHNTRISTTIKSQRRNYILDLLVHQGIETEKEL